jgi:hypothetical protein
MKLMLDFETDIKTLHLHVHYSITTLIHFFKLDFVHDLEFITIVTYTGPYSAVLLMTLTADR